MPDRNLGRDEMLELPPGPHLQAAARLFYHLVTDAEFAEFLTLPAYELLE